MDQPPSTCPRCAAPALAGRYCSNCGAALAAACSGCGVTLSNTARFCHRCGTAVGSGASAPAPRGQDGVANALPWAVAAIALVALIALVAGQRFSGRASDALPTAQAAQMMQGPAPDISQLSPRQRADRLFDRIMTLDEQGKADSVHFFAEMGISAFQMLPELDLHARYDMGRIGEVAGIPALATAQADTILAEEPNHLLGLILAAGAARMRGDDAAVREHELRFLAAEPEERRRGREEYIAHQADIEMALARARR